MIGRASKSLNRKYCIKTGHTVPYQQQQNYAEGRGGNFKFAVCKLLHMTPHAPREYWCYEVTLLDKVKKYYLILDSMAGLLLKKYMDIQWMLVAFMFLGFHLFGITI